MDRVAVESGGNAFQLPPKRQWISTVSTGIPLCRMFAHLLSNALQTLRSRQRGFAVAAPLSDSRLLCMLTAA